MIDVKCPICGGDLEQYDTGFVCYRHCLNGKNVWGGEETLKELERTRKALEIAVDALKSAHNYYEYCIQSEDISRDTNWDCTAMNMDDDISEALEQITALEQKDVK